MPIVKLKYRELVDIIQLNDHNLDDSLHELSVRYPVLTEDSLRYLKRYLSQT